MSSDENAEDLPEAPESAYARTHGRPGKSLASAQVPPSENALPRPSSTLPHPSPGPEFLPPNPPSSYPLSPPVPAHKLDPTLTERRHVYLSSRSWAEFARLKRVVQKRGLVTSSGRGRGPGKSGGRPAISEAAFAELLEAYRWKQRVCARSAFPRKVDETAIRVLRRLYGPHPFGWPAPFTAVDRAVLETFPSYRPPKRLHVIINYCENGLVRPVYNLDDEWTFEDRIPPPNSVSEYHYLRGNLGYRPLDEEATVAG